MGNFRVLFKCVIKYQYKYTALKCLQLTGSLHKQHLLIISNRVLFLMFVLILQNLLLLQHLFMSNKCQSTVDF